MARTLSPQRLFSLLVLVAGVLFTLAVQAEGIQSLDSIRAAARQALSSQLSQPDTKVVIGSLDPRLRLPQCGQALNSFFPQGQNGNRMIIGIRCAAPKRWTVYVTAEIHQTVTALVAKDYLQRGAVLKRGDLATKQFDASELRFGYFTDIKQVLGKTLKRHLNGDAVITPSILAATKVIKRGERVSIIASTGGISVEATGQALEDGGLGDIIRVKNLNSGKVVEGAVEGPGRVKINF